MVADTALRVQRNTRPEVNRDIIEMTARNIDYYRRHPRLIPERLVALDREWDIERCLELGSASLSLLGLVLGTTRRKRWLIVPAIVQSFFMQHILQGWCPPLPIFRRLGIRTAREIETERYALKVFLGDFERDVNGENEIEDTNESDWSDDAEMDEADASPEMSAPPLDRKSGDFDER
jgi:hypothetical protein